MSLTCYEEIGRVRRVGRGGYEDANDLSATSRACWAHGIWRTTRHTDRRPALHRSRPLADQSGISAWQAEREVARHARHPREDVTKMVRGCYEETAPVEFQLNPSLID